MVKLHSNAWRRAVTVCLLLLLLFGVPKEIQAENLSFAGKGTSTVTITEKKNTGDGYDVWIALRPRVSGYVSIVAKPNATTGESQDYGANKSSYMYGWLELCNKSKKRISYAGRYDLYKDDARYNTIVFGVKAKETYYIRADSYCGVDLTATVKPIKRAAGTTQSKAALLKKGKTVRGYLPAGKKTVDWYQLPLKKSGQVKLIYTAQTDGSDIKITFCGSNGERFHTEAQDTVSRNVPSNWMKLYRVASSGKRKGLAPGTYYVRVERENEYSNGYYTLRWK